VQKEAAMAITIIQPIPDRESYWKVTEKMFPGGTGDPPEGLVIHTAGEGPKGFRVVDVWESRELLDRFINDMLMPAIEETGVDFGDAQPEVIEVINTMSNAEARV
jgi:hypothetical protein